MKSKFLKINIVYVSFFILLIFNRFALAYTTLVSSAPSFGEVTANVNFRSQALTSAPVIKVLNKGTILKIVGEIDNYYIVQLETKEVGVVRKEYVSSTTKTIDVPYTNLQKTTATINNNNVNYRTGPGTSFKKIGQLDNGTSVTVIGTSAEWYLIVTENGTVGMVIDDYISLQAENNDEINTVLSLINSARIEAGLKELKLGSTLPKIAQLKATDMVQNNYFSHTSPTYGSPFEMMQDFGITYISAGENIAGNPSLEAAVEAWLNSETHKQNLLSKDFNYIGIGIEPSDTYGNIIVVLLVEQ